MRSSPSSPAAIVLLLHAQMDFLSAAGLNAPCACRRWGVRGRVRPLTPEGFAGFGSLPIALLLLALVDLPDRGSSWWLVRGLEITHGAVLPLD